MFVLICNEILEGELSEIQNSYFLSNSAWMLERKFAIPRTLCYVVALFSTSCIRTKFAS